MVLDFDCPDLNHLIMKIKRFLAAITLACLCLCASAQTKNHRDPGFRGYAAITDQLGVFVGADVSLGTMLDRKNYLGAGIGAFAFAGDEWPLFGNLFLDYRHYFKDAKNSFFMGSKLGFSHGFGYNKTPQMTYNNGILAEPNLGWSWGLKSGNALELAIGATLLAPVGERRSDRKLMCLPKISIGFSF